MLTAIKEGKYRLLIITGNAGDGKTAFIRQVEESSDEIEYFDDTHNGARIKLNGVVYRTNYDGSQDEANLNENTTYRIRDLIDFFPDMSALRRVLAEQDMIAADPSEQTWDSLNAKTAGLETVLPLSGSRLAETARLSARPYETLMDYYSALCQTCSDIGVRYDSYLKEMENPEGTSHADAPSNIRYYVENSLTKQYYTNLGAASSTEARNMIASDGDLTFLFDGVRSMAIMVANSENTLSERVASKFIDTVFLGSGERVVIAVNPGYPAGDELHGAYLAYERREPVVIASIVIGASALACMIILFVLSICRTGRRDKDTLYPIAGFDLVPSEIAAGLCMLAGILIRLVMDKLGKTSEEFYETTSNVGDISLAVYLAHDLGVILPIEGEFLHLDLGAGGLVLDGVAGALGFHPPVTATQNSGHDQCDRGRYSKAGGDGHPHFLHESAHLISGPCPGWRRRSSSRRWPPGHPGSSPSPGNRPRRTRTRTERRSGGSG